jgi:SNF2 family DNA or RNA helicase
LTTIIFCCLQPTDVYSLLRFLDVEPLCDKAIFKQEVTDKIKEGRPCGLTRLRTVMMHVSLRRLKGTVDIALSPKTTVIKRIPFKDDAQKSFHDALFSIAQTCLQVLSSSEDPDTKKAFNRYVFSIVLRVRQACCSAHLFSEEFRREVLNIAGDVAEVPEGTWTDSTATDFLESFSKVSKIEAEKKSNEKIDEVVTLSPKIKALLRMIEDSMEEDEKGVIFSSFTSFLDLIGQAFKEHGVTFTRLDGTMTTAAREAAMTSFAKEEINPRFILCSLKAAGSGINLTRGSVCFLVDPWFNQASEDQAADRVSFTYFIARISLCSPQLRSWFRSIA